MTTETKLKISLALKGRRPKNISLLLSPEVRAKIVQFQKGKKPKNFAILHSPEVNKKRSLSLKGRVFSEEHRRKLSAENSHLWKGGITPLKKKIRGSFEYRQWRKAVFERDSFICQVCGKRGGDLEADHIKPFAYFPELRFSVENGQTLCVICHRRTDTYGSKIRFYKAA